MTFADLLKERLDVENQDTWKNERHADIRPLFHGSTSLNGAVVT